ncbi:Hypothetical predicted protein [Prunus dulcis]|uniref:Methyl-CPG-binding domain protein 02 n=1 Tax=Prunus dulcis TaxID=3755 RepID=A0A5E4FJN5_PRUDU|nr:methyl-CpG-binding domain-containing protein 2 [Prunus dulcis]VVA27946.1 Hypothetical predicted protein [Prunus dulcis]
MDSRNPTKITFKLRREEKNSFTQEDIHVPSASSLSSSSSSSSSSSDSDNEIIQAHFNSHQLVLYDPATAKANANANAVATVHEKVNRPNPFPFHRPSRVLPSVGAFTVQCASCFKWRLIPTKEKYEEIREHILEQPFYCETAREWRDFVSCDDPEDITQDGSRLWAIDKPNIAQPPPGWQRLLRIRGEGGTRFADVYYESPSGKKLRSSVEIQKYLLQHPEYLDAGVTMSQFSFQTPKPLQEDYVRKRPDNYVKKRPAHLTASSAAKRLLEPGAEVSPIAWVGPDDSPDLQLGRPACSPYSQAPLFDPFVRPTKKRATRIPSKIYRANAYSSTESR